jgi:hypothetical protein
LVPTVRPTAAGVRGLYLRGGFLLVYDVQFEFKTNHFLSVDV